jgi:predicted RNase H-like nuclease (RuvC/YqgF family)
MRRLAVQTEAFGRSIGTTGEAVSKQLSSLMTIQGRTQFAGRLSQIASQVGAEVDIRAIMSSDPAEQERGIRASLQSFSRAYQRLQTPAQRRALGLVLQRAYNLPADAIRTALTQGLNTEAALQKFEQARKAAAGGIRDETKRAFVTLKESIDGMKTAFQLQAGQKQLEVLNKTLEKLNNNQTEQSSEIKKFNKNIAGLADKVSKGVAKGIEEVTKAGQEVIGRRKRNPKPKSG